jgi:type I restriction-modification system DNA methylase subunit
MMHNTFTKKLVKISFRKGASLQNAHMLAAATISAWSEGCGLADGRSIFYDLAAALPDEDHGSALTAARDWLRDPGLSLTEWESVEDGLRFLDENASAPIDWNAEAAQCLEADAQGNVVQPSLQMAHSISRVIDLPLDASVGCLFSASATLAWVLAEDHEVTAYVEPSTAIILALLSHAACRRLKVRRENPIDGSLMPAPYFRTDRSPPFEQFDFLVSIPPFGVRVQDGPDRGMAFESYQIRVLAERARTAFYAIIPDGVLFRETEAQHRERLLSNYKVTVLSLPAGALLPATSISTCLLRLECGQSDRACLIDGRGLENAIPGRPREGLIAHHLEAFRGLRNENPERTASVLLDYLAENDFSLQPDRYIKTADLAAIERALAKRPVVTLGDITVIERGKAPTPLRERESDPSLVALEIAPSDLVDGVVRTPTRQQAFEAKEETRIRGVTVHAGDILVSIKGTVGIIGIVQDPGVHLAGMMQEPWIVGQSLAIIRLLPEAPIPSPAVLAALLSAPWVQEKLESMSGASTVRTLSLSALRKLALPIPTAEECARAESALADITVLREQIAQHQSNLAESRHLLWSQLWQLPEDFGE